MNLQSGETNALMEIQTDDFIFNAVDDNRLILSFIKNSIPTTQEYIFKTGSSKDLAFDSSNIMINNNLIYGLDSSSNIFRIDSNGNLETISNFPVLKFYINDDYLIYIDFQGKLMSLSINGTNRVISDSVGDFVVFEDSLYYISPASKNNIFKTQLNGRHKEIVIANSNTNLKFSEIKKLLK